LLPLLFLVFFVPVIASHRVGAERRPMTGSAKQSILRHSGMVRQHQTRNLEIPGSMLRIAPE
jgi:hypothetical protein